MVWTMNNTIPYKWPFYGKMIKADSAQIALKKNKNDKSSCRSIINNKARKRSGSKTDDCYCNVVKVGVNHFLFKIDSQNINLNRLKRTKLHFFLLKSFVYGWQDKVYWNIQSVQEQKSNLYYLYPSRLCRPWLVTIIWQSVSYRSLSPPQKSQPTIQSGHLTRAQISEERKECILGCPCLVRRISSLSYLCNSNIIIV